jgi:hypothetical protein
MPTVGVETGSVKSGTAVDVGRREGTVAVGNVAWLVFVATRVGDATIV